MNTKVTWAVDEKLCFFAYKKILETPAHIHRAPELLIVEKGEVEVIVDKLYSLQNQVEVQLNEKGVYALGAENNGAGVLVISNTNEVEIPLAVDADGKIERCEIIGDGKNDCEFEFAGKIPEYSVMIITFNRRK